MLTKLIKYEFKSVYKTYLPLYGVTLLLAILNKIGTIINKNDFSMPQSLLITAFAVLMTSIVIVTLVLGVLRFSTNLLKDEGYLMFTLPVARWNLIMSKMISAVIWSVLGIVVGIFSAIIMAWDFSSRLFYFDGAFFGQFGDKAGILLLCTILSMAIVMILGIAATYSPIYLAIALGHMSNKNKTAMSFVSYIGIWFAWDIVTKLVSTVIKYTGLFQGFGENLTITREIIMYMPLIACTSAAVMLIIFNAVNLLATNYLLKNRLNLE